MQPETAVVDPVVTVDAVTVAMVTDEAPGPVVSA